MTRLANLFRELKQAERVLAAAEVQRDRHSARVHRLRLRVRKVLKQVNLEESRRSAR